MRPEVKPIGVPPSVAALVIVLCVLITSTIDGAVAESIEFERLENSSRPATMEECARARRYLGRPSWVVSRQHRSAEPWLARTCAWRG